MRAAREESMRTALEEVAADEITLCTTGEGTTSQGEFWEAMTTACTLELPVLFLVEDNGYAISVPVEVNTPGGSISRLLTGFPGLYIEECDGTDVLASYEAASRAVAHCRARRGPALLHAHVVRPYSHSMSDDERLYRPQRERQLEAERDPITRFRSTMLESAPPRRSDLAALRRGQQEIRDASDRALAQPQPPRESATLSLTRCRSRSTRSHRGFPAVQRLRDHHGGPSSTRTCGMTGTRSADCLVRRGRRRRGIRRPVTEGAR
jgi:2-oxoisovalerate dehydrogenase E1 component